MDSTPENDDEKRRHRIHQLAIDQCGSRVSSTNIATSISSASKLSPRVYPSSGASLPVNKTQRRRPSLNSSRSLDDVRTGPLHPAPSLARSALNRRLIPPPPPPLYATATGLYQSHYHPKPLANGVGLEIPATPQFLAKENQKDTYWTILKFARGVIARMALTAVFREGKKEGALGKLDSENQRPIYSVRPSLPPSGEGLVAAVPGCPSSLALTQLCVLKARTNKRRHYEEAFDLTFHYLLSVWGCSVSEHMRCGFRVETCNSQKRKAPVVEVVESFRAQNY
ncbi:unnamed protein product [Cyprideis torosa]|uniref:Uncharacterized protein n=1 Tax=Cyprideis torosa TaxID=163714 RepID=A0A7R8ZM70_9CRUS|nr:unnamed protein product [Cyprideis torosa]CAG0885165.1 unnamed protein product [Cyprideis torosa]